MIQAKILFAATEAAPLAKVGGVADVAGTLPPVLRQLGQDVRLIMPFYGILWEKIRPTAELVWSGSVMGQPADIFESVLPGTDVPVYLVAHWAFAPQRIYGGEDENWRFTFYALAVAEFAWTGSWKPNIIHCHDWQTAMIPIWMRQTADIGTVFTIHNMAYQGPALEELQHITWVPEDVHTPNAMSGAILYADQVSTVSPTYAQEIQTPTHGENLQDFLVAKGDRLRGILNGINREKLDPAHDPALKKPFTAATLENRSINKKELQFEAGLLPNPDLFLLGMVSRLVDQKGLDLILETMATFLTYSDAQVVILGTGDAVYQDGLQQLMDRFPGRMSYIRRFDNTMAQLIYAGSDAFLMPSRFEPCGISQMVALRYGSVPIVRRTGGLADTVSHHNPALGTGTGYCFDQYQAIDFYTCLIRAWEAFRHKETWKALQRRGMMMDFSWEKSAFEYIHMYEEIMQIPLLPSSERSGKASPSA